MVSQMNVAQAQVAVADSGGADPGDRAADRQHRKRAVRPAGRNPGRIARGKSVADLKAPQTPAGTAIAAARATSRCGPGRAAADRRERADRRGQGAVLPDDLADRRVGQRQRGPVRSVHGPTASWSYGGSLVGPIFTGGAVTAQVSQAEGAQQAALFNYENTVQSAFADVENALIAQQKTREKLEAQQGPGRRAQRLLPTGAAAVRGWLRSVLDGAAGRSAAISGAADARAGSRAGFQRRGQRLPGAGRRLGHAGRWHDVGVTPQLKHKRPRDRRRARPSELEPSS